MVICPIAIVAGCQKCPAFKVCPMTKVLGDQKNPEVDSNAAANDKNAKPKRKA